MNRFRLLLAAVTIAVAVLPARLPVAMAAGTGPNPNPTPAQGIAQLTAQLDADQAKLDDLNNQVEQAQADVDVYTRKLAADQQQEVVLDKQLTMLGRLEYEQPVFSLSTVLEATSLQQLFSNLAQARLVAHKQGNLLDQAHQLKGQDQQVHDQMSTRLTQVQTARDSAAQLATQALTMRNSAQDAMLRARATSVNAQAVATQSPAQVVKFTGGGSFPNRFTFGYCTWYVATRRNIPWLGNAIEWFANARPYGFPEGQTPQVGSIMVSRESGFGHVAYVESVNGNSFTVSEMNWTAWDVVDRRTIQLGGRVPIVGFIYGQ
jgi:surface antigen